MGQGTMEMDMQDDMRRQADGSSRGRRGRSKEAYDDLQRGYMAAQPGIPTGLSAGRSEMSRRTPPPMYMAEGGQTYPGGQETTLTQSSTRVLERLGTLLALWVALEVIWALIPLPYSRDCAVRTL